MHKLTLKGINTKITDHRSDKSAIPIENGFTISRNGNRVPKATTRGWSLLVSWKDGSSDWMPLKDLKDSYPVQMPPNGQHLHLYSLKRLLATSES